MIQGLVAGEAVVRLHDGGVLGAEVGAAGAGELDLAGQRGHEGAAAGKVDVACRLEGLRQEDGRLLGGEEGV